MKPCTVRDCERPLLARGMCSTHYMRLKRGQPIDGIIATSIEVETRPVPSRPGYFAGEDGHIYSGQLAAARAGALRQLVEHATHDGYRTVRIRRDGRNRTVTVAPMVAEAWHGPRPEGQQVRHLDGTRTNNAPGNLAYGSAKDNADDRERHGTTARGSRVHNACRDSVVTTAQSMYAAGHSQRRIARELNVSQSSVSRWVRGEARGRAA